MKGAKMDIYEQAMYDEFKTYFPRIAKNIDRCKRINKLEFKVKLFDGNELIFNTNTKTIRYLNNTNFCSDSQWICEFGIQLRKKILEANITQKYLAKESCIPLTTINNYINGRAMPTLRNAERLSRTLNCSIDDLIKDMYK